jgi:RNA recognition motif-containing protein
MAAKANPRLLFVGGLADEVTEATLRAAFIPFGDLTDCQIPIDYKTRAYGIRWLAGWCGFSPLTVTSNAEKPRGFGFVQFEQIEVRSVPVL